MVLLSLLFQTLVIDDILLSLRFWTLSWLKKDKIKGIPCRVFSSQSTYLVVFLPQLSDDNLRVYFRDRQNISDLICSFFPLSRSSSFMTCHSLFPLFTEIPKGEEEGYSSKLSQRTISGDGFRSLFLLIPFSTDPIITFMYFSYRSVLQVSWTCRLRKFLMLHNRHVVQTTPLSSKRDTSNDLFRKTLWIPVRLFFSVIQKLVLDLRSSCTVIFFAEWNSLFTFTYNLETECSIYYNSRHWNRCVYFMVLHFPF